MKPVGVFYYIHNYNSSCHPDTLDLVRFVEGHPHLKKDVNSACEALWGI
jgi:hypothetical protein